MKSNITVLFIALGFFCYMLCIYKYHPQGQRKCIALREKIKKLKKNKKIVKQALKQQKIEFNYFLHFDEVRFTEACNYLDMCSKEGMCFYIKKTMNN